MRTETLESRRLLAATLAVASGDWSDVATWSNGIPDASKRAIVSQGRTVTLDATDHVAQEIVVHGQLVAEEGAPGSPDKSLTTRWMHVNSGGVFQVGTESNRFDNHGFVLTLTGTNPNADFTVETAMMGIPGTMPITDNDGFLMTGMGGSLQLFGDEKLSFTKLAKTAFKNSTTIDVENVIERNFDGVTSAASDGSLVGPAAWEVGDEIVIASSSNNYSHEDVRTITAVRVGTGSNGVPTGNTRLTLNSGLTYRHYGNVETYKDGTLSIDLRAEVALLNRSIVVEGTQDTDSRFGNRARYGTGAGRNLGVGGHAMFMPGSGQITIDSAQFDKMGQTGEVGRYPVHWHLGADRSGDVMRNSSVTNSNNRGVIVHGTQGLLIEGNVLHDIHGHGFFLEDGAEFNNEFRSNIALGIHKVGGNNRNDPFIVPGVTRGSNGKVNGEAPRNGLGESSHDTGQQVFERFLSSSAYWITNPDNIFVGNISAGSEGSGFWFILPDRVIGLSRDTGLYNGYDPSKQNLGAFDHNTSHSSPVGLTFDRGSDIRGGGGVGYTPPQRATFNAFTGYKHPGTAVYHRGNNVTFDGSKFADVKSGSFNTFSQIERNILFVGHSQGNSDPSQLVAGYKLYDGPGQIIGAHFAGFAADNAHTFINTGGAHKHAMTRAEGITFENDGTADHLSVYWQDAGGFTNDSPANAAGRPDAVSGIVLDVDGSLTGHAGGGVDHVLTPRVDFYRDSTDITPAGWNAYISDDRFGYLQLNTISGSGNFPYFRVENGDGNRLVVNRRNITRQRLYTKLNAGDYTFTFTEAVPAEGFTARMQVMRGSKPGDSTVYRFKGVGTDYRATSGTLAPSLEALRSSTSNAYFRDAGGDLWLKIFQSSRTIQIRPTNDPLPSDEPEVESLVLVDTENDNDIGVLVDGQVINLTSLPSTNVSVRASANEETGSVRFDLTGPNAYHHTRTESVEPYALFGDQDGHFNSEPLAVGPYTLVVTPYTDGGAGGTAGTPVAINFEIIQPIQLPYTVQTVQDGTIVQADEFDLGGQAVAYHDTTPGNSGSSTIRVDEDVDTNSNGAVINRIVSGEWLEFSRDVIPGIYHINVNVNRFSLSDPAKGIRLLVADNAFSDSFTQLGYVEVSAASAGPSLEIPNVDLTAWGGEGRVFRVEFFEVGPDIIVAPRSATLQTENGSYLDEPYGAVGENWFNGSGLTDPSGSGDAFDVETGDPVPQSWPLHQTGNHRDRVSRIRSAVEENTLTIDLGGTYDLRGMVLWNSTEDGQTDRGFEHTVLSYSTDGGTTFSGSDTLTWTQLENESGFFAPEVNMFDGVREGVTNVRMVVDNFSPSGSDSIVMASEIRFIGQGTGATGSNLSLNFDSLEFTHAQELDFGDAPATYGTMLADDGARHVAIGPQLGATRDSEHDGNPVTGIGDEGDGSDEDGVLFGPIGADSPGAALNIEFAGVGEARVDAWIDFNHSGTFDPSEKILSDVGIDRPMQTLNYDLNSSLAVGNYHARVRISTEGGLAPTGLAADGEVEDYVVNVVAPPEVESVTFNGGTAQRSSLDSVRVTFTESVDIPVGENPFRFTPVGSTDVIPADIVMIQEISDKTVVDLRFVPGGSHVTSFGSLQDGDYELKIDASRVTAAGVWLAGDDRPVGDHYVTAEVDDFFRKYGDIDGSGIVELFDFAMFRRTFGLEHDAPGYLSGLDSDGDGAIKLNDFAAFRSNFGT